MLKRVAKRLLTKQDSPKEQYKKSYSQSGEDLIVKYIFDVLGISRPSYMDIGAHHPYYLSNTALFYELGSRGINIEPDPTLMQAFLQHRKEDRNLNIGIAETKGVLDFYIINNPVLNTFSREEAENYYMEGDYRIVDEKKVPVNTIQSVLTEYCNGQCPEFLTIDAEGVDEVVLKSLDLARNFPIVICVETISFSNTGKGEKNHALIDFIRSQGYLLYADTYINSIFVRKEKWEKQ
jgi:FkbM family methyltransferase